MCAQWEPTKARSFEELIAVAAKQRREKRGGDNGRDDG
jgi:hypothetical protein